MEITEKETREERIITGNLSFCAGARQRVVTEVTVFLSWQVQYYSNRVAYVLPLSWKLTDNSRNICFIVCVVHMVYDTLLCLRFQTIPSRGFPFTFQPAHPHTNAEASAYKPLISGNLGI